MKQPKQDYEATIKSSNSVWEAVIIQCDIKDGNLVNSATNVIRRYIKKEVIATRDILKIKYTKVNDKKTNTEKAKILLEFTKIELAEIKSYKEVKTRILAILKKLGYPEATCKKNKFKNWMIKLNASSYDEEDIIKTLKKTIAVENVSVY